MKICKNIAEPILLVASTTYDTDNIKTFLRLFQKASQPKYISKKQIGRQFSVATQLDFSQQQLSAQYDVV